MLFGNIEDTAKTLQYFAKPTVFESIGQYAAEAGCLTLLARGMPVTTCFPNTNQVNILASCASNAALR
jgi:hypothetical protein